MPDPAPALPHRIRPARREDAAALADFLRALSLFPEGEAPERTPLRVGAHLALCLADGDSHAMWVAEDEGGAVAGYVAMHLVPFLMQPGPEGYVSELFVRPDARGTGLGRRLLDTAVRAARERGWTRLQLTNPRDLESYRRHFYAKAGWEERPNSACFHLVLDAPAAGEGGAG